MATIWVLTWDRNPNYKRQGKEKLYRRGQLVFRQDQEQIAREMFQEILADPRYTNAKLEAEDRA